MKNNRHKKPEITFRQCGQALPLGLAFLMMAALGGIVLFNTGQLASEKSQVSNAADAATYSGLIWQARALNFQAYTNRAMVANQVSIAQMVSLSSWTNYGRISTRNINNTIGWIPPLKPFTQAAESAFTAIDNVVQGVASVAIPVLDTVLEVLSATQQGVYMATFAATPSVVKAVAEKNDSRYSVESAFSIASMAQNAAQWSRLTTRYEDDDADMMQRKASIIMNSRDAFSQGRNWDTPKIYLSPVHRLKLVKEGQTRLFSKESSDDDGYSFRGRSSTELEWEWKGKDTLSLHMERFSCSWRGCKWKHAEIPIGWGETYASEELECSGSNSGSGYFSRYASNCPSWGSNRNAERLAHSEAEDIGGYNGVRAYYDLTDLSARNQDPRLVLRVEVSTPASGVKTSTKNPGIGSPQGAAQAARNGIGTGMFYAEDKLAADAVASVSSGEVYFKRPLYGENSRGNALFIGGVQKKEYASLYNPYWEVRLTELPKSQQYAAWALRSPEIVGASSGGAVSGAQRYASSRQQEVQQLLNTQQALQTAISVADNTQQRAALQQQLTTVQSQLSRVQQQASQQLASVQQPLTSGLQQGSALGRQLAGQTGQVRQALQNGVSDQLQQQITDQLEDTLLQALTSAAQQGLQQYGGQYYGDSLALYNEANDAVDYVKEEVVAPLQDQLQALEDELQATADQVEAEYRQAGSELQSQINGMEGQIRNLETQLAAATTDAARQEIQARLDGANADLEGLSGNLIGLETDMQNRLEEVAQNYQTQIQETQAGIEQALGQVGDSMGTLQAYEGGVVDTRTLFQ